MKKSTREKEKCEARRKRVRSWEQHLAAWKKSGLAITRYCAANSISVASFHYWRRRLKNTQAAERQISKDSTGFVALSLGDSMLASPSFELSVRGRSLRIPMRFEENALRRLLFVLEAPSCG